MLSGSRAHLLLAVGVTDIIKFFPVEAFNVIDLLQLFLDLLLKLILL